MSSLRSIRMWVVPSRHRVSRANLLGGRANRYELHGLTAGELGGEFDLDRMLNHRHLPRIYEASCAKAMLYAYVADSLKEGAWHGLTRGV